MRSPRRPTDVARAALRLYRDADPAARLHTTIRWWSAPFAAVEARLPRSGRVLEIGCGHGLFCVYAALAGPEREVMGTDIDADKTAIGAAAAAPLGPRVRIEAAQDGAVPDGPWDAIVILDVLYLLPADHQRHLLTACAERLAPGGVLLIKEMADAPAWKARWNRTQETLSVKVLRITEGHDFHFVPTDTLRGWLTDLELVTEAIPLDAGRLHPHQVVVARRGPG